YTIQKLELELMKMNDNTKLNATIQKKDSFNSKIFYSIAQESNTQKRKKQNKEEINYDMQDTATQDNNNNSCEATNTTIEEPNSRFDLTLEILGIILKLQINTDEIGEYHTQIELNKNQIMHDVEIEQEQAILTEKENKSTIKSSSLKQTINMKIEVIQVNDVNMQESEQNI
ncbi:39058_t:CDS:2, partial [Gigaspora margarita]